MRLNPLCELHASASQPFNIIGTGDSQSVCKQENGWWAGGVVLKTARDLCVSE